MLRPSGGRTEAGVVRTEVGVVHGLAGGQPGLVVVAQQLVQEVQRLWAHEVLVLTVDEPLPPLTGVSEGRGHDVKTPSGSQLIYGGV